MCSVGSRGVEVAVLGTMRWLSPPGTKLPVTLPVNTSSASTRVHTELISTVLVETVLADNVLVDTWLISTALVDTALENTALVDNEMLCLQTQNFGFYKTCQYGSPTQPLPHSLTESPI